MIENDPPGTVSRKKLFHHTFKGLGLMDEIIHHCAFCSNLKEKERAFTFAFTYFFFFFCHNNGCKFLCKTNFY